jgi:ribonuclease E
MRYGTGIDLMSKKMIINAVDAEEVRIAILENGVVQDFDIETQGTEKNKGNIYKALVAAVEPSLNAAFVDYGAEKHGFLTINDVDAAKLGRANGDRSYRIQDLLRPKQEILVQVEKDEVGSKGAVLTMQLSLAGRYLVLMPGGTRTGVSRKIDDEETRQRMRDAAAMLSVPEDMGVIIRTAGKDRSKTELQRDLKFLLQLWQNIEAKAQSQEAPALILKEQSVVIRALRDYFSNDIDEIVVDSDEAYDRASEYMHLVMPRQRSVLTRYVERRPIFHHYRIEEQLQVIYSRKVPLPSGGSLVIDPTEALVAIDVNSGKQKGSGQEETALSTNLQAAKEIARQLRLRDLGGIIVIDFIDMAAGKNERRLEKALKDALSADKARIKIGRVSPNGTLELTRQRIRSSLRESVYVPCRICGGVGQILNPESHAVMIIRELRDRAARGDLLRGTVRIEPEAGHHLRTAKWPVVQELEKLYGIQITIAVDRTLHAGQHDLSFDINPKAVVAPLPEPNLGPPPRYEEYEKFEEQEEEALEAAEAESTMEEIEQEAAGARAPSAAREAPSRRSRRNRARGPRDEARIASAEAGEQSYDEDADLLGMPSFELLDPREVGLGGRGKLPRAKLEHQRRSQKRARPRLRPPAEATVGGLGRPAQVAAAPASLAPQKPSLFSRIRRLFSRSSQASSAGG